MLSRYWHTLRYLRPVQIYGRAWYYLYTPSVDERPAPAPRTTADAWRSAIGKPVSMVGAATFRLLNHTGGITDAESWNNARHDKLWLYNLHYFDDLNAKDSERRFDWHRDLVARWILENRPGRGIGWEPFPLSRRIVNWIKWALAGHPLEAQWLHSLAVQVRFLRRNLEWHLLGNHFIANAIALVAAGLFFVGSEANEWRNAGLAILSRELPEQILPDGGHFELSPMYHAIVLEDLLDLINIAGVYGGITPEIIIDGWHGTVLRMLRWLAVMTHPDGEIAFFNDAAFGIAPRLTELEDYARRLALPRYGRIQEPVICLEDSGYIRIASEEAVALLDVAQVGPDYLPGHAHADTLSFELSLYGRRTIVNSGTSQYGNEPERSRQRSTAAHSTVEVDGQDSSEVWAGFRVARRSRPFDLEIDENASGICVSCAHDGYRRLPGRIIHRRQWKFQGRSLSVADTLEGRYTNAVARFHLHPDIEVEDHGGSGKLILPGGQNVQWQAEAAAVRISPGSFHPEFGLSVPNHCIEVEPLGSSFRTMISW